MTTRNIITILALTLTLALATTANAAIIDITAGIGADGQTLEQTWLSSVGTATSSESFEGLTPNSVDSGSGVQLAIGTLYGYGHVGSSGTHMNQHSEHATDGVNYWSNAAPNSSSDKGDFILELNPGTQAIGFYTIDFHDQGRQVDLIVTTASGAQTINLFPYTGELQTGSEVYWVVEADEAIQSLTFVRSGNDGYAIDGITTAATPIPGAVWLLGSGLVGLLGLRRRNRS